jgi:sugar phosphate isomerase/epimerase
MTGNTVNRRTFLRVASGTTAAAFDLVSQDRTSTTSPALHFSLAHLTVLGCAPPEMTYIAARAGYNFVSYRLITMHLPDEPNYDLARNDAMLRQTRVALAQTGLKVHDVELARIQDGVDVKSYLPALETAAELGATDVITSIWTQQRNYAIDCLGELCDLGAKLGLSMNIEFVTWANVGNLAAAIAVCRSVGRANCGLLIDVLHFDRSRVGLKELDAVPREWLRFAHVSDAPARIPLTNEGLIHTAREERLYPGEGAIDIAGIVNRLPPMPYSLEIPNLARVRELGYAEHAWRCLEAARKYFSAHPRAS